MQKTICSAAVVACLLFVISVARSEESGWKMPNMNPLAGKGQPPTSSRSAAPPTSGWKMPRLWPQAKAQPKRRGNQPSTWNRVTTGTQQMLSKTADAINPWDDQQKKTSAPPKITGSNSIFSQSSSKTHKKDSGVKPASWFGGEKEEKPTVNSFLSQPRP
jgi:hypothetical protein